MKRSGYRKQDNHEEEHCTPEGKWQRGFGNAKAIYDDNEEYDDDD